MHIGHFTNSLEKKQKRIQKSRTQRVAAVIARRAHSIEIEIVFDEVKRSSSQPRAFRQTYEETRVLSPKSIQNRSKIRSKN